MVIVFVFLWYFIYNGLSIGLVYAVPALCYNNPYVYKVQTAPN